MDSEIWITCFKLHRILWRDVISISLFELNAFEIIVQITIHITYIKQPSFFCIYYSSIISSKCLYKLVLDVWFVISIFRYYIYINIVMILWGLSYTTCIWHPIWWILSRHSQSHYRMLTCVINCYESHIFRLEFSKLLVQIL
jgi:hypothetical protein